MSSYCDVPLVLCRSRDSRNRFANMFTAPITFSLASAPRLPNVQSLAPINLPSATFTTCLTIGGTSQEPAERARFNPSYKSVLRSLSVHLSGVQVCCDAHHQLRMGNPCTPATICRSQGVVFFKTVEFRPFAPWELFRVSSMQRSDVSLTAEAKAVAEFSHPSPTRAVSGTTCQENSMPFSSVASDSPNRTSRVGCCLRSVGSRLQCCGMRDQRKMLL